MTPCLALSGSFTAPSATFTVRWILAVACIALGTLCSAINAGVIVLWLRRRIPEGRSVSGFPLIGACFFYAGFALLPIEGKRAWWWLPFVLDPSCLALLALGIFRLVRGSDGSSR